MIERAFQDLTAAGLIAVCVILGGVSVGSVAWASEQPSAASETRDVSLKYDADRDFRQLKGTLASPVSEPVAHGFGRRKQDDSKSYIRHTGMTYEVDAGTKVGAAESGLVVFAQRFEGFGKVVIIDHGDDFHTLYAHLERIDVEPGEEIERDARLGLSGASQSLEGPKLYFELRENGQPIDPEPWLFQDEKEKRKE